MLSNGLDRKQTFQDDKKTSKFRKMGIFQRELTH